MRRNGAPVECQECAEKKRGKGVERGADGARGTEASDRSPEAIRTKRLNEGVEEKNAAVCQGVKKRGEKTKTKETKKEGMKEKRREM